MSKKKYPEIEPGQKVDLDWRKKDYCIACCDCNLVHKFRFTVVGNKLRIRGWRDNRRTSALRKNRNIPINKEEKKRRQEEERRADCLDAMIHRMADTLVDKDALIYSMRLALDQSKEIIKPFAEFGRQPNDWPIEDSEMTILVPYDKCKLAADWEKKQEELL